MSYLRYNPRSRAFYFIKPAWLIEDNKQSRAWVLKVESFSLGISFKIEISVFFVFEGLLLIEFFPLEVNWLAQDYKTMLIKGSKVHCNVDLYI